MNNNILNNLQLYRTKNFSGLVDENMLSNALAVKPHEVGTVLTLIFGMYEKNTLDFLTKGLGRVMEIENREYEWSVMTDSDRAIPIQYSEWNGAAITTTSASTDLPGINLTALKVWLPEAWFGPGAILAFDNKNYQVRVQGEPYQDGDQWVYTLKMADGDPESYVLPTLLAPGKMLSRIGSAYEEYSEEADILNYQTPVKLRNQLTTSRLSYDITGDAATTAMVISFKDPKSGKTTNMWAPYQEWVAMREWYKRLDRDLVYSQYNAQADGSVLLPGSNGRPVYRGAGLLQQISPANVRNYTTLTTSLLDDFLFDLSYNLRNTNDRKFVALTGEMGMKEFDRILKDKASAYNLIDSKFVTGSGQDLALGGQFTTYKMLNGIELTLKHFPMYDDTTQNRELHPISGKPLESYRMTFVDFSMRDGESNIRKVIKKDRDMVMWHTAGSVAPGSGHSKSINTLRGNAKDGYSVHFLEQHGVMMADPTSSGELIMVAE